MSQNIESSEQQTPLIQDFQNANAIIESIGQPRDSQPTKLKVKNFKNRVFQLIKIYSTHSPNINPLVQCLKQQMFLRQPQKMRQLINDILNKPSVTLQNLQQLLEYYKIMLLYKLQKTSGDGVAADFLRVLKKIASSDKTIVNQTILSMLKSFAFQRKCQLSVSFFLFVFRKYDGAVDLKKLVVENCHEYINDEKLRNAQKKQLKKLLAKLDKTTKVKIKKEETEEEEDDDDIKVVGKKIPIHQNLKTEKREEKHEIKNKDKIEEQGQEKPKKQISVEQQQKLKRIKENKKKNRKQNKKNQKSEQANTHQNGQRKTQKPEQTNNNQNGQRKSSPHGNKFKPVSQQKPTNQDKPIQRPISQQKPHQKPTSQDKPHKKSTSQEKSHQKPVRQEKPNQKPASQEKPNQKQISLQKPSNQNKSIQKPVRQEKSNQKPVSQEKPHQKPTNQNKPIQKSSNHNKPKFDKKGKK